MELSLEHKKLFNLFHQFDSVVLSNPEEIFLSQSDLHFLEVMSRGILYSVFHIVSGSSQERDEELKKKLLSGVHFPALSTRLSIDLMKSLKETPDEMIKTELLNIAGETEKKISSLRDTWNQEKAKPRVPVKIDEFTLGLFRKLEKISQEDKIYYTTYYNYQFQLIYTKFIRFCYNSY